MKILIVNGFSTNPRGVEAFSEFQWAIKKGLNLQKELVDTETEFFIRDKENIDDFLYELDSSYVKKDAAKLFDHLDIIFIAGDPYLLPWAPSAKKIMVLIRMCIRVKKNAFLCSFAMQALVFLCATNFEKNIHIINGKGKGGKIGEIVDLEKPLAKLRNTDFFLDNLTGDLYSFNYDTNEWTTKANAGIHYEKTVQEYHSLGKYIIKAPIYRPKNLNDDKNVFTTRRSESVCFIKKNHVNHWIFDKVEKEFLICSKSPWNIHTFNFLNREKTFTILAENQKSPVVIEMKNCIAVLFEISNKYYNTITILNNYIKNTIKMIKTQTKDHCKNIETFYSTKENLEVLFHHKQNMPVKGNRSIFFNVVSKKFNENDAYFNDDDEAQNEFKHVGFSASQSRIPAIYKKNIIREKIIQNVSKKHRFKSDTDKEFFSMIAVRENFGKTAKSQNLYQPNINSNNLSQNKSNKAEEEQNEDEPDLTRNEIRRMLHPHISSDALPSEKDKHLWVPGYLHQSSKFNFRQRKSDSHKTNEINSDTKLSRNNYSDHNNHHPEFTSPNKFTPQKGKMTNKIPAFEKYELLNIAPNLTAYKYREETQKKWLAGAFKT